MIKRFLFLTLQQGISAWNFESIKGNPSFGNILNNVNGQSSSFNDIGDKSKQLSDMNILLPLQNCEECRKAYKKVIAYNGCYKWKISHPKQLQLDEYQNTDKPDCSNLAELSIIDFREQQTTFYLSATDLSSTSILKTVIKVAKISSIELKSQFSQINRGDKLHLQVRAKDINGNTFSTLDGMRFEWQILSGHENIRRIPWKESDQMKTNRIFQEEGLGDQGDDFVLKAIQPGYTSISVKIMEKGYENIQETIFNLTIVDPFVIRPDDQYLENLDAQEVYLLPTSDFKLKLSYLRKQEDDQLYFEDIKGAKLKQYSWNLLSNNTSLQKNNKFAKINNSGLFKSKNISGIVEIQVNDLLFNNNKAFEILNIVEPKKVYLQVKDISEQFETKKLNVTGVGINSFQNQFGVKQFHDSWVFVENRVYLFKSFLIDENNNKITLTQNVQFNHNFSKTYFEVLHENPNSSELVVRTLSLKTVDKKAAKTIIDYKLSKIVSTSKDSQYQFDSVKLSFEQEALITAPVKIIHPEQFILLPLNQQSSQEPSTWLLKGGGGSGVYIWESKASNIVDIENQIKLRPVSLGQTEVILRDFKNPENFANIIVEVQKIANLVWLEKKIELDSKKSERVLSIIGKDYLGRDFTNCSALQIEFDLFGGGLLQIDTVSDWNQIAKYLTQNHNQPLLELFLSFKMDKQVIYADQLKGDKINIDQFLFNNIGICSQVIVSTNGQAGLNRVKGKVFQDGDQIESGFAEIAAYSSLEVDKPKYTQYFDKFTSLSQEGQEFLSFSEFTPKDHKFVIAFGSKLNISILGGSNYWLEQSSHYQTQWKSESEKKTNGLGLKVNLLKQNYTSSLLEFWCMSDSTFSEQEKNFKLLIDQKARKNNELLQPASHQTEILVSCIIPQKMRILWSQSKGEDEVTRLKELLPRSRVEVDKRITFVMAGDQYEASTLYFNDKEEASIAQDSLITSYTLSNSTIANIIKISQSQIKVSFGKSKGFIELTATSESFNIHSLSPKIDYWSKIVNKGGSFWSKNPEVQQVPLKLFSANKQLQDKLLVNIVENVVISPQQKTIYLRGSSNPFEFIIKEGSGYFNVNLNDSSLAEKEVLGRKIKIIPVKEGPLSITVTDIEIPNSTPSIAILIISDIKELRLETPLTLLEQYQQLNLTVTAWDYQGAQFDPDQSALMSIEIQTEMTGIHQATDLLVTKVEDKPGKFIIQGQEQGNYLVNAFSNLYKSSGRATSKAISIEVFPMLRLEPLSLLLTPFMRYSVQVFGGPNKVESNNKISLQLEIENRTVATINSINEITGNLVGDTSLTCRVSYTSTIDGKETTVLVSRRSVQIRVRLVTQIAINSQTEVYKGSLPKYKVELKYFDETFSQGVIPASFNWNTSDNQVLKLYLSNTLDQFDPQRQNQDQQIEKYGHQQQILIRDNLKKAPKKEFNTQFNSSTIFLKAKKPGQSTVSVEVAISYPSEYDKQQNWFQTTSSIFVYDRIKVPVSEYTESDQSTHLYLLPRNAVNTITTNVNARLKMGYSMQSVFVNTTQKYEYQQSSNPIIQIIEDRKIKTLEKYGKVTLIMEEYQSFGDQVAMLNILITDIKSITAINYYDQLALPLGSETHIPIRYLNEHGHLFANNIEGIQIGYNLSHPKVANANLDAFNQSIQISALSSGECTVMIYLISDPTVYDVFKIRVATMIQPSSPVHLHIGAKAQFKMVEKNDFNLNKTKTISKIQDAFNWKAQNSSVLRVDAKTGAATALNHGKTLVTYENGVKAESQVYVSKVSIVEISQGLLTFNVDEAEEISRIRLSVFLESNPEQEVMPVQYFEGHQIVEQNIKIKCESNIPDIVLAVAEVNKLEGYFCKLSVKNIKRDSTFYKRLQSQKPEIFIYVQTGDVKDKTYEQKEFGKFQIKLYGNLNIESQYRKGVTLYQNQKKKSIKVTSLSDFDIIETDYNGTLKVQKIKEDSDSFVTSVIVQVLDSQPQKFEQKISLRNKANGEITTIPVLFNPISAASKSKAKAEPREEKVSVTKQTQGKSNFQFYLILVVALAILFFVLADEDKINWFKENLFCCFRRYSDGGDLSRSYYSARNQSGDLSRRPTNFMRSNPYLDSSARQVHPMQQYGRGSVVSPRTMQNSDGAVYKRAFAGRISPDNY